MIEHLKKQNEELKSQHELEIDQFDTWHQSEIQK